MPTRSLSGLAVWLGRKQRTLADVAIVVFGSYGDKMILFLAITATKKGGADRRSRILHQVADRVQQKRRFH